VDDVKRRLQENVIEVRVLKEVLSSGPSRVVNGTARP